jgi:transposase
MDYPTAVIEKAKRMEKLLQRVAEGESLTQACADLEVSVDDKRLAALQAKYEKGGRTWEALLDGRFGHKQKAHSALLEWLYKRKEQDETLRAPDLVDEIEERYGVHFSDGHINELLRAHGLSAPPGRPRKGPPPEAEPEPASETTESLDNAGVFFPGSSKGRDGGQAER